MKILVIGGTGTVGSQVVRDLLARKAAVRVLTRSPDKAKALPPGVEAAIGDLLDPATVRSMATGVDGVFLLNAVSTSEAHQGIMAVNGAHMAKIKRLVYLSVHRADAAPHLPHFGAKLPIETVIKASGIPYTILRPNNFYQNDYWYKDVMLQYGVYPQPLGDRLSWRVDIRDIAELAATALLTTGHEGQTYDVVGPHGYSGSSTAEVWSRALGRSVKYGGNDLEAWERQSLQYLPAWMVFDFKLMYGYFQENGFEAKRGDVERLTKALGHPPRKFEDFVLETAKAWKG